MKALSVSLSVLFAATAMTSMAVAEYDDVILFKLNDKCTVAEYVKIKDDFNATWGKQNGYIAAISVPLQAADLTEIFWVGRSANAAAFGKAWDLWRDALTNSKSVPAKLQARFDECGTNLNRRGFDVY